jgi:hypothetical protein
MRYQFPLLNANNRHRGGRLDSDDDFAAVDFADRDYGVVVDNEFLVEPPLDQEHRSPKIHGS